ncbi:disease resistance protein RPP5-like [Eucalyptus grandis]|uniref:disease resistance protein RPP5-like n=1 Tax=Eucalyptus grandis TaxID=71139 RepID=UPI00192EC4B3|nr:disease resistance protein RPP5-like [Eucalyptus grandis]
MLARLREVPEEDTLETLRVSYDNLDKNQQQIFLDIACFLFNENKTDAIYMWANCQFYPMRGLKVLTDRCLIKIMDNDKIWMHDQLIDLGRRIVRQESPFNPGKRSRLWTAKEALEIIKTKMEFKANNMYLDRLVVCKLDAIDFKDDSKACDLIKRAQNLKVLSVTRCSSITTIPDVSKCSRLERLTLANCFSLERIESFIGDLASLIKLKIKECKGLMDLPEEVGALVKLKHFSLSM